MSAALDIESEEWKEFKQYAKRYYKDLLEIAKAASGNDTQLTTKLVEIMASPIKYVLDDWREMRARKQERQRMNLMTDSQKKYITDLTTRLSKKRKIGLTDIRMEAESELGFPIVFDQLEKEKASRLITWLQSKLGE